MAVWEEQERKKMQQERLEEEKRIRRDIRDKERREIDKNMIARHRRNQNEISGQNKFTLEKELRKQVNMSCPF